MSLESEIFAASKGLKIADMGGREIQKLIKSTALMFGCREFQDDELQLLTAAFKNSFGRWSRDEINLAIRLAMGGEIQVDTRAFGGALSGDLVGRLMAAYRSLKVDVISKYRGQAPDEHPDFSVQEQMIREGVNRVFSNWLQSETSLLIDCYVWHPYVNQLVRDSVLTYGETDKQMYEGIARRNLSDLRQATSTGYIDRFVGNSYDDNADAVRFGYYYALLSFFENCRQLNRKPY